MRGCSSFSFRPLPRALSSPSLRHACCVHRRYLRGRDVRDLLARERLENRRLAWGKGKEGGFSTGPENSTPVTWLVCPPHTHTLSLRYLSMNKCLSYGVSKWPQRPPLLRRCKGKRRPWKHNTSPASCWSLRVASAASCARTGIVQAEEEDAHFVLAPALELLEVRKEALRMTAAAAVG